MKKTYQALASAVLCGLIAGCGGGGGGDDESSAGSAEGFYYGELADGRAMWGIVLPDNTYYVFYHSPTAAPALGGFVQGTGNFAAGRFTSTSGHDFKFEGGGSIFPVTVEGTYTTKKSFNGRVSTGGSSVNFTTLYDNGYELVPSMSKLQSNFYGEIYYDKGGRNSPLQLAIDGAGTITGTMDVCDLNGTATPYSRGNGYKVSITYSGVGCALAGQTLEGAGFYDTGTPDLFIGLSNASKTYGAVMMVSNNTP